MTPAELVWLLASMAKGDDGAFERLHGRTCAKLFGVVLRILRREDLAEQVVQDAYVRIWKSAGQFDPAISPIGWMVSIARSRAIDLARKAGAAPAGSQSAAGRIMSDTPEPLARRNMTPELKQLLDCAEQMEPARQRLVLLAYYNGWSREQLAEKFDLPLSQVRTRLRRSLIDMRQCLGIGDGHSEDHIALSAEYVLGTLDADERALVETMMIVDPAFMAMVEAWDRKLAPLHQMVAAIEPPAHLWHSIKMAAGLAGVPVPIAVPDAQAQERAAIDEPGSGDQPAPADAMSAAAEPESESPGLLPPQPPSGRVPIFKGRRGGGYAFGAAMTALAAVLAVLVVSQAYRPDLLPEALRVQPQIRIVEMQAPAPPASAQWVAVLQRDAEEPAFILTIDAATRMFTARPVDAAPQSGKSFELWIVSDRLQRPRSLGVIGERDFTARATLASYDPEMIREAVYAVTVEPQGGSPTGRPTSNPIYAGRLVESVPAGEVAADHDR